MRVVRSAGSLEYPSGVRVGFVPTMGAFHEGHLELMRVAKAECGFCVVSLFVNPTQFSAGEDFEQYPRDEANDFAMAEAAGVDVMFAPATADVYRRRTTTVRVEEITTRWEGERRPGHFDGVATVVCKLFHLVRPDTAFFGTKDYQQCLVIERMVEDLDIPVKLRFVETVRESDGLAMSSRNRYLASDRRELAPMLYRTLCAAADDLSGSPENDVVRVLRQHEEALTIAGFTVEYLALVDPSTLEPLSDCREGHLIVAARLGDTRLIDNLSVPSRSRGST